MTVHPPASRASRTTANADPKWVLIVDDEPDILESVAQLVEIASTQNKIHVCTASSGPEALGLMRSRSFDLILSDFHMDPMDGVDLLKNAKQIQPEIRCVLMSGDPHGASSRMSAMHIPSWTVLAKPFSWQALTSRVLDGLGIGA